MGVMASMLWWPEEFCERLASHGRFVIHYDNRDTGLSTKYPPGEPGYAVADLVDDALQVLDAYAIAASHIVGMSLGGMIGQLAALKYPSRVLSLTAISSSPVGMDKSDLPQSSKAFSEHSAAAAKVNWSDRAQVIDYMVEYSRLIAGVAHPFQEAELRAFIEHDYDRSGGYLSATNHGVLKGWDAWPGRIQEMETPLLVVHGAADPVFPVEHGIALAEAAPGAKFLRIEGGGHELHRSDWDLIVDAIAKHTADRRPPSR